jgi:hypothetical protein
VDTGSGAITTAAPGFTGLRIASHFWRTRGVAPPGVRPSAMSPVVRQGAIGRTAMGRRRDILRVLVGGKTAAAASGKTVGSRRLRASGGPPAGFPPDGRSRAARSRSAPCRRLGATLRPRGEIDTPSGNTRLAPRRRGCRQGRDSGTTRRVDGGPTARPERCAPQSRISRGSWLPAIGADEYPLR